MFSTHPRPLLRVQQLEHLWSHREDGRFVALERVMDELLLQDQPHPNVIVLKERLRERAAKRGGKFIYLLFCVLPYV